MPLLPCSREVQNRLISLKENQQPPGLMVRQRLEFHYDAGGRRIAKKMLHAEGNGTFVLKSSQVFLYDGSNMIGEFILQSSAFSEVMNGAPISAVALREHEVSVFDSFASGNCSP